jgi:hypothetical protein
MAGKLLVCNPCMKARDSDPATQPADNSEVVAAGRFVVEVTSAKNVLTYQPPISQEKQP